MEDLEPMGIDFIKLGLRDVLYDPKTKEVFTPNTGKIQNMSGQELPQAQENDIIQERANPNHDPKTGKFTFGKSGSKRNRKIKYAPISSNRKLEGVKMGRKNTLNFVVKWQQTIKIG